MLDVKRDLEGQVKELKQTIERNQYELSRANTDLKELRSGNQILDATKYTQEKSITEQMLLNQAL
jgi:cell division protein FtsL